MRKSIVAFVILAISLFWLSVGNSDAQDVVKTSGQPQKKEQKVRVVIRKDGQLIEKDSTIVNGKSRNFTFTTNKMTVIADSVRQSMGDDAKGKTVTVTVIEDTGDAGQGLKSNARTYTYSIGDSLQKGGTGKTIRKAGGKPLIIMNTGEGETYDLPFSSSPGKNSKFKHKILDPYAFDPTDPTIVSYKKKDVGKDKEKITIVRKKVVNP